MAKMKIYSGDESFRVYDSTETEFSVADTGPHGNEYDDVYAINAVKQVKNLTISSSSNQTVVEFTPITDNETLSRIQAGKTKIRIQILKRYDGHIRQKSPNASTTYYYQTHGKYYYNYLLLPYGTFWTNQKKIANEKFVRVNSHHPNAYGYLWLDLTAAQLQEGRAVLQQGNHYCALEMFVPAVYRSGKDTFYYERLGYRKISDNYIS